MMLQVNLVRFITVHHVGILIGKNMANIRKIRPTVFSADLPSKPAPKKVRKLANSAEILALTLEFFRIFLSESTPSKIFSGKFPGGNNNSLAT